MKSAALAATFILALDYAGVSSVTAFAPLSQKATSIPRSRNDQSYSLRPSPLARTSTSVTELHAFLPPSNNRNNDPLVSSLLTLGLTLAFFLSPLGAIVLSVFNSLLLLSILTPVLLLVGFNVWQYFNTISGTCPSCGAPVTVMKRQLDGINSLATMPDPTVCFNCGSILVASPDNKDIEFAAGTRGKPDSTGLGLFESFFSNPNIQARDDSVAKRDESAKRFRREQTVIDVDVEDDQ